MQHEEQQARTAGAAATPGRRQHCVMRSVGLHMAVAALTSALLHTLQMLLLPPSTAPQQPFPPILPQLLLAGPSWLLDLPLLPLENICRHLSRADVWALLRCCKVVYLRLEDSDAVWGDIYLRREAGSQVHIIVRQIASTRRAYGRLHIAFPRPTRLPVLSSLTCSQLTSLALSKAEFTERPTELPQLPKLRRLALTDCSLPAHDFWRALTGKLPALSDLEVLRVTFAYHETLNAAFEGIDLLTGLTRLQLGSRQLLAIPMQLSGLPALRELLLSVGLEGRGLLPDPGLQRLSHLSGLTSLSLTSCLERAPAGLERVPTELSVLTSLRALDLSGNLFRGEGACLELLLELTSLTSLKMASCGIEALPCYLSALRSLVHLDLSYNPFQLGA